MLLTSFSRFCICLLLLTSSCMQKSSHSRYYDHALSALERDNIAQSLTYLDKAIAKKPLPHYLALKATVEYQVGNFKQSKLTFEKLLQKKEISPHLKIDALNNYAATLQQLGFHKKAKQIWLSLTKEPLYSCKEIAWFNLGMCSLPKKGNNKAELLTSLTYFDYAIAAQPAYVDALFFKAHTQQCLNKKKESIQTLKKLLEYAPDHQMAKNMCKHITP
jgi:tetratricopeptide (TPR) repeat protein